MQKTEMQVVFSTLKIRLPLDEDRINDRFVQHLSIYNKTKNEYNGSMMKTIREFLEEQINEQLIQAVVSGRRTGEGPSKVKLRPVELKGQIFYQASMTEGTKVYHKNYSREEMITYLEHAMEEFRQLQVTGRSQDGSILISKKGKATIKTKHHETTQNEKVKIAPHNRVKQYILKEGTAAPFLVDLGVMTKDGKIVASRYDKFRQINRFLEFIRDILPKLPKDREITILDFGCGKSYLTFAMYYYLKELKGYDIRIIGLDLKKDVIKNCSRLAVKYGYDKLNFYEGSIEEFEGVTQVDMVVTLHACDTATDYALYKALRWGASVILSVPCCQHELNKQISASEFEPITDYGILKERFCALATDGIRAKILEEQGYDTQILEFIDMEHTPKNLLIRALHRKKPSAKKREKASKEVNAFCEQFGFAPTLWKLLQEEGGVNNE